MSAEVFCTEDRVGLHEREVRGWIERLRTNGRSRKMVANELERALDAALDAGLVIHGQPFVLVPPDRKGSR